MIDPAIIRLVGFRSSEDRGRLMENIVFLHLKMLGKEIFFHKEQKECDFIIRQGNRVAEAIQVSSHLSDKKVRIRECDGLLDAIKTYDLKKGLILTENEEEMIEIEGYKIQVLPVWKWLLSSAWTE